jgi:hypothetical protein
MSKLITFLTVLVLLAVTTVAQADLSAYTGGTYSWVAYNSGTSTQHAALPANTTEFTIDTDYPSSAYVSTGELLRFAGGGTGVTVELVYANGIGGGQHFASGRTRSADAIFADTLVGAYVGRQILHYNGADGGSGPSMEMLFTGLDPSKTYTFAGSAEYSSKFDSLSVASIVGADGSINESVLTSNLTTSGLAYFGKTATTTSISYNADDLAIWSGINPGADGSFSIIVQAMVRDPGQGHNPAFDAFALAEEGNSAPEPATISLLALGGLAMIRRRRA